MRTHAERELAQRLARLGISVTQISYAIGVPRSTVRDWVVGVEPCAARCTTCGQPQHDVAPVARDYAYLFGLYLGDGCISTHPRGVYKLRIILDAIYPGIIEDCVEAVGAVMPTNRINRRLCAGGYSNSQTAGNIEVYAYSKAWPCLFPQHGPGRKHERPIVLADWQAELVARHPDRLLRGLIQSDGCRFMNTSRNWRNPRYSFSNRSDDIRRIFCDACDHLGVRWTTAPHTVYVSRKADVARLDEFIGPKA